jgi:hypothetical protein
MIFFSCKSFTIFGHPKKPWIRIGIQPEMPDPDPESMIRIQNNALKILSQMRKHVNCEGLNVYRNLYLYYYFTGN